MQGGAELAPSEITGYEAAENKKYFKELYSSWKNFEELWGLIVFLAGEFKFLIQHCYSYCFSPTGINGTAHNLAI